MSTRRPQSSKKSLKERAEDLVQAVMDAVGSLMPEPALVPVPARPRAPRQVRRRY